MGFVIPAHVRATFASATNVCRDGSGMRARPERVVLEVADGVTPSDKPPVRVFLGTEPAHHRAERVFVWSIEQTRDPSRVYDIYLMKELAGFDRRRWLTGFTNYRFAIPDFAGASGRAIWNDVDQAYLGDPAELFDIDMGEHGILAISPESRTDTAVMLIDCARMAPVWSLEEARHKHKNTLIAKALAVPGLVGELAPEWHARDEEYVAGRSKLLHWTVLHTQPWRPLPQVFAYQKNPVGDVWFDLERGADAAGYQVFSATRPSAQYTALLERLRSARDRGHQPPLPRQRAPAAEDDGLADLVAKAEARTVLDYRFATNDDGFAAVDDIASRRGGPAVTHYDPLFPPPSGPPAGAFDGVVCSEGLDYLPGEDVPWVVDEMFARARRFVHVTVATHSRTTTLADGTSLHSWPREPSWWHAHFEAAARHYPGVHWELVLQPLPAAGSKRGRLRAGGSPIGGPPVVWALSDGDLAHTAAAEGLAQALGWPYELKELCFTPLAGLGNRLLGASRVGLDRRRSASLAPPWPDVVIAAGRRTAPVARWIGKQSEDRARLVQLGREGGEFAEAFDAVVTPGYCRLWPHPRRIETIAPLNPLTGARLAEAQARCQDLFGSATHPRIVLLVGDDGAGNRLDKATLRRMGEEVGAFARGAGGSVFAVASGHTGAGAIETLRKGLGATAQVYRLQFGRPIEDQEIAVRVAQAG